MTLRVLHLVHQFPPDYAGGTELYTQMLARGQAARGYSVAIFCPSPGAADQASAPIPHIEDGVRVYRAAIGKRSPVRVFLSTFVHSALDRAWRWTLDQEQPDLVHAQHLIGMPTSLIAQLNARRIPYVVTLHDYWFFCANAQLLTNYSREVCSGPRRWINCGQCAVARAGHHRLMPLAPGLAPLFAYRAIRLKGVLRGARAIIAPSDFVRNAHRRLGLPSNKIRVIPHGISVPLQSAPRPAARRESGPLRIAYIGGLALQKGAHVLLEAVNDLPLDAMRLSIYGDTDAYPEYVAQLQETARHPGIEFRGRLPRADVWSALSESDIIVIPSIWHETSSLVAQEAFAAGVPVIASRIGALPERVRDGVDGLLFPPGDADALRAVLLRLINDRDALARLRHAIRPVRTIDDHVIEIEGVYAAIAA